jgi:molecular chaperone HscB
MATAETRTYFDAFGLPVRYALDLDDLERRYREVSRRWHPDRFANAPASERAMVLKRATDLNQAFRVLRNDIKRAEYLLKLHGCDLTSEEPGKQPAMDLEFLDQVLELREELMDARLDHDMPRLKSLKTTVEGHVAAIRRDLQSGFAKLESGDSGALGPLSQALLTQRYYQRFLDEIEAQEEADAERQSAPIATV